VKRHLDVAGEYRNQQPDESPSRPGRKPSEYSNAQNDLAQPAQINQEQGKRQERRDHRHVRLRKRQMRTMHGLATILQTSAIQTLALPSAVLAATTSHTLQRIGIALSTEGDLTLTKERAL
jgi:hypothetical protein